jgi:lipopolysaccharide export system permease protein
LLISDVANDFEQSDDEFRTDREKSSQSMVDDIMKWESGIVPYRKNIVNLVGKRINLYFGESFPASPDSLESDRTAFDNLIREADADSRSLSREREGIQTQVKLINSYYVEVYKKYSIPAACIVFVLIGAPLGVLARRGNMGISIGISLGLFVLYWAFLIGGEDLADRSIISPFVAMWSANILIGVAGLYLMYIVSTEKSLWTVFKLTRGLPRRRP